MRSESSDITPPRLARWFLQHLLPQGVRGASILGDLREELEEYQATGGLNPKWWYWKRAIALAASYGAEGRIRYGYGEGWGIDMRSILGDVRYGARGLLRMPGSASLSVLILALGVSFSAVAFSVVWGVYFRGLGLPEGERLHLLTNTAPDRDDFNLSVRPHHLEAWKNESTAFEAIGSYALATMNMTNDQGASRYSGALVSGNLFDMLGVPAAIGRVISEDDDRPGAEATVVLADHVWRTRFGGTPDIVGQTVRIHGALRTIIGVMPPGFRFPILQDLWLPQRLDLAALGQGEGMSAVGVGKLRPEISLPAASAELQQITERQVSAFPEINKGLGARAETFVKTYTGPELKLGLGVTLAAAILVLLAACANVANLLLARAAFRTREAAIRGALGASKARVILPFLSEAMLLALAGATAGLFLADLGINTIESTLTAANKPYWMAFQLDPAVFLFVGGLVGLITVAAGTAPALLVTRGSASRLLRDQSRGSSSLRLGRAARWMITMEVAASCVLLVGAGLVTRSMLQFSDHDFGLDADQVMTARITLPGADYPLADDRAQFWNDFLEGGRAIPGVASAALTAWIPGNGSAIEAVAVKGQVYASERDIPSTYTNYISTDFFVTLGVGIDGRTFLDADQIESEPVAIVNQSFTDRFIEGGAPLGGSLRIGTDPAASPIRIVGLSPDLILDALGNPSDRPDGIYLPATQADRFSMSIVLRSEGPAPLELVPALRRLVAELDPNLPVHNVGVLEGQMRAEAWFYDTFGGIFFGFGAAALLIASLGLYGVLSFVVTRRYREIGVRMALGATAGDVRTLIVRQGLQQIGTGLIIGLVGAFIYTNGIAFVLFEVNPKDPMIFAGVPVLIVLVGLLASWIPALRATRIDPIEAMRRD